MTTAWSNKKLGEIIKLEYGKPLSREKRIFSGRYPVYGANGVIARTDDFFHDRPSIIVGRKGSAGEINLSERKFWPLDVTYFVTFDEKKFDRTFLYYQLKILDIKSLAKGVKPGINRNDVYSLTINYPPLPEQRRIVAKLDEAFAAIDKAIENTRKNVQNSKELFTSYLDFEFSGLINNCSYYKLSDLTKKISSGATPLGGNKIYTKKGVTFVRSTNVYDEGFSYKNIVFINGELAHKLDNVTLNQDDILLNITGASITRCCIVPQNILPARINQHVLLIRPNKEQIIPEFLHYSLISGINKNKLLMISKSGGSTREALTKKIVSDFIIPVPNNKNDQIAIVNKLKNVFINTQKLELCYLQKLSGLEELKQSMLQSAFSGLL